MIEAVGDSDWLTPAGLVKDDKLIHGKDGWLFLANDRNDVVAQHSGERLLSEEELARWRSLLEARAALADRNGAAYAFLVAPDTHGVYPEKLPDEIVPAPRRPIHQLLERFGAGTAFPFMYPLEELKQAKAANAVCASNDAHWSEFGAFVAYRTLIGELAQRVRVRRLPDEEVAFVELNAIGDLSYKLPVEAEAPRVYGWMRAGSARLVHENLILGTGALYVTECRVAPDTTCLVFGDSYTYELLKFLSESFGRLVFAHSPTLDPELIQQERPDVILSVMAERFLVVVPDDDGAPSHHERARAKREEGAVRGELPYWRGNTHPSPAMVEGIRARLIADGHLGDAAIVSALAYAGLRPDEVKRLRWQDVGRDEIHVRSAEPFEAGLDLGPERRIRLLGPLADDLERWRDAHAGSGPAELVFPGSAGGGWAQGEWLGWHERVLKPLLERYGLEGMRPYDLHHVFCVLMIYAGLGPEGVGREAGYPAARMAEVYEHQFWIAERSVPAPAEQRIRTARVAASRDGRAP